MFPRSELRKEMASSLAGEGVFATPIYWTAIALMLFAELVLAGHQLLLATPPYRWLVTAVTLAWGDDPVGALKSYAAGELHGADRAQFAGGGLDLLGVVIMFVAVGVVVYAGFSIMSTTIDLTDLSDGDPLHGHQENFTEDYGAMFGFIALILLVAFLAVIIIYLQVARGAGQNGGR